MPYWEVYYLHKDTEISRWISKLVEHSKLPPKWTEGPDKVKWTSTSYAEREVSPSRLKTGGK